MNCPNYLAGCSQSFTLSRRIPCCLLPELNTGQAILQHQGLPRTTSSSIFSADFLGAPSSTATSLQEEMLLKFPQGLFSQQELVLCRHYVSQKRVEQCSRKKEFSFSPEEEKRQCSAVCGTLGQASEIAISRLWEHWQQLRVLTVSPHTEKSIW